MNPLIAGLACIPLLIGIALLFRIQREKRYLNDNDPIEGTLVEYQRIGKRLYPIITYVDNGEEKAVRQGGVTNLKMIKEGSKVRIVNIGDGKIMTDYSVKLSTYYAVAFFLSSALIFVASVIA